MRAAKKCNNIKNYDDGNNIQLKAYNREELFEILRLQPSDRWNKAEPSSVKSRELMFTQITINIIITNDKTHKHKKTFDFYHFKSFGTVCFRNKRLKRWPRRLSIPALRAFTQKIPPLFT